MERDEVVVEVEATQSVYGDDCVVFQQCPPHLHLHIRPRTADVSSEQFVEAIIAIQAGPQYPDEPPKISIIEAKGLDEKRQKHLIASILDKACELSSYSMLVALCEEAVESLTSMNHPDGSCPLCLSPLVEEGGGGSALPFMKLMSCFHCFHCECIVRWCNWLQMQKELDPTGSSNPQPRAPYIAAQCIANQKDNYGNMEEIKGTCPVCRKVFHAKDIEHMLDLVRTYSSLDVDDEGLGDADKLLQSDSENMRRQKFEAILRLQQENNGVIEPKKTEVLMPGMFLPRSTPTAPPSSLNKKTTEQKSATECKTNTSSSSKDQSTIGPKGSGARRHRNRNSKARPREWVKKGNSTSNLS